MKSKFFEKNEDKPLDKLLDALQGETLRFLMLITNQDKPLDKLLDALLDALQGETLRFLMGITSELAPLVKFPVQPIEEKLNAKEATQEIDKLSVMQILVLLDNYQYGLRGKHLRDLYQQANPITHYHFNAIKSLIQEKNQSPEKAIEILINASPEEAKNLHS